MNNHDFDLEKQKSEIRYRHYQSLVAYPEWQFFVKDMQEQCNVHKNVSVGFSQKNNDIDAKRQAWIIEGIEEALSRPNDVIQQHESIFSKIKHNFCALCGQLAQRVRV